MITSKLNLYCGLSVVFFLAIAAFQTGCTNTVYTTTPGSVLYVRGEVQGNFDRRFDVVARAANKALSELQFGKIEEKKDALIAIDTARTADDIKITVRVEKLSDSSTLVHIRAGTLGNEKLSFAVYNKIKELL